MGITVHLVGDAVFNTLKRVISQLAYVFYAPLRHARVARCFLSRKVVQFGSCVTCTRRIYRQWLCIWRPFFLVLLLRKFLEVVLFASLILVLPLHEISDFLVLDLLCPFFLKLSKAARLSMHVARWVLASFTTEVPARNLSRRRLQIELIWVTGPNLGALGANLISTTNYWSPMAAMRILVIRRPWILDEYVNQGAVLVMLLVVLRKARTHRARAAIWVLLVHFV